MLRAGILVFALIFTSTLGSQNRYKRGWGDPLKDHGSPNYTCDPKVMAPSKTTPTSVHSVRPADIKLIMALGDSLTAANGAGAIDPLEILLQYRGLAFLAGGDKGLDEHVSIPNILAKYNPNIFGQSHGICAADVLNCAYLNIAQPGAKAEDLPGQATILVQRFTDNDYPNVDKDNDWKLLSIFIGGNDICNYCRDPTTMNATEFAEHIADAVKIIHDNIPRVLVSLTTMLHLEMIKQIDKRDFMCSEFHLLGECKCDAWQNFTTADIADMCVKYEQAEVALQDGRFDDKDDFTLVNQVFFNNATEPPRLANGTVNLDFFAPDCFHFSQLGHAIVSTYVWNNMLEPVGSKNTQANLSVPTTLNCPDPSCPFIRTTKNSQNCAQYLTPSILD
uniref:Phospholipase B1, membrane-associated n=1 Tax=Acrobeloides nanus TaxID=290746 RepID=A0A914CKI5_9BILA